jgi:hypothetical protein
MKRSMIFTKSPKSMIKIMQVPCDFSVKNKLLSYETDNCINDANSSYDKLCKSGNKYDKSQ